MATVDLIFIDTAFPGSLGGSLHGAQGLCFYAGGDTLHVWTEAEVSAFHARYLLPVFVRSNPVGTAQAAADATAYLAALKNVYHAPPGVLVALDSETSVDPVYVRAFADAITRGGYKLIDYGSDSVVHGNHNPDGYYWGAQWTGAAHIAAGDVGTQYVSFNQYDLSEFGGSLPLWNTEKKTVTTTAHPVAPAPPGNWERGAVMTGIGTDGNLWQTTYDPATGKWGPTVRVN